MNPLVINTEECVRIAHNMEQRIESLQTLIKNAESIFESARLIWEGDASNSYMYKFQDLKPNVMKLIENIEITINEIYTITGEYDKVEEANQAIANSLSQVAETVSSLLSNIF